MSHHPISLVGPTLYLKLYSGLANDTDITNRCNEIYHTSGLSVTANTILASCNCEGLIPTLPLSKSLQLCKSAPNDSIFHSYIVNNLNTLKNVYNHLLNLDPSLKQITCPTMNKDIITKTYNECRKTVSNFFTLSQPSSIIYDPSQTVGPHFDTVQFKIGNKPCTLLHPTLLPIILNHECDPGHHWMFHQLSAFPQLDGNDNMACIEGWGMYCERFYEPTLPHHFGFVCSMILHFLRALCDFNLQNGIWNTKTVGNVISDNMPFNLDIPQEVGHISKFPNLQCCYILGYNVFDSCCKKFRNQYPDWKVYHNQIIRAIKSMKDNVDLSHLERLMDRNNVYGKGEK